MITLFYLTILFAGLKIATTLINSRRKDEVTVTGMWSVDKEGRIVTTVRKYQNF